MSPRVGIDCFQLLIVALSALLVSLALGAETTLAGEAPTDVFTGGDVSTITRFLGGLHPLSVHFPLALIFAAFVFELIFIKSANSKWRASAFHTLTLGATISLATISLGLMASEVGPFLGPDAELLALHRLFGLLTSALSLVSLYFLAQSHLSARSKNNHRAKKFELTYRVTLALATTTVFIAGHFGAELAGL
jgi:uncharacterized membrane protein